MNDMLLQNPNDPTEIDSQKFEENTEAHADVAGKFHAFRPEGTSQQLDAARIDSSMRPHCLHTDACAARTPGKHCQSCNLKRLWNDPAFIARRTKSLKEKFARDPVARANHAAAARRNILAFHANPENKARLRQRAIANLPKMHSPDAIARRMANKARMIQRVRQARLPWCPPHMLDSYMVLRRKGIPVADARRMILEEAETEGQRTVARIRAEMLAKEARRKREAY